MRWRGIARQAAVRPRSISPLTSSGLWPQTRVRLKLLPQYRMRGLNTASLRRNLLACRRPRSISLRWLRRCTGSISPAFMLRPSACCAPVECWRRGHTVRCQWKALRWMRSCSVSITTPSAPTGPLPARTSRTDIDRCLSPSRKSLRRASAWRPVGRYPNCSDTCAAGRRRNCANPRSSPAPCATRRCGCGLPSARPAWPRAAPWRQRAPLRRAPAATARPREPRPGCCYFALP